MRKQRSARELEKEALKTYNIQALWQQSSDLGMISAVKSQDRLDQAPESLPNNGAISAAHSLSEIPLGGSPSLSKQEIHKQQQVEALKDLTRLLKLVTEQEKKYEDRLSPHIVADNQNQQCGIIFLAYSLALKLAIRVETRPNQVTIL